MRLIDGSTSTHSSGSRGYDADGDHCATFSLGRNAMGLGHRLRPPAEPRTPRRCHPITASSAISYACSPVTVVPATIAASDILALNPDGIFLSNGPGDPAATGTYAVPLIRDLIEHGIPTFGICLGHRMLGIAVAGAARGRCTRAT